MLTDLSKSLNCLCNSNCFGGTGIPYKQPVKKMALEIIKKHIEALKSTFAEGFTPNYSALYDNDFDGCQWWAKIYKNIGITGDKCTEEVWLTVDDLEVFINNEAAAVAQGIAYANKDITMFLCAEEEFDEQYSSYLSEWNAGDPDFFIMIHDGEFFGIDACNGIITPLTTIPTDYNLKWDSDGRGYRVKL